MNFIEAAGAARPTYDSDLIAEALRADAIMANARFHRDEAEARGMDPRQAELHRMQYGASVGNLAVYGMGVEDIPAASLKV